MRADLFKYLAETRRALHEVEASHPGSEAVARLHRRMLIGLHNLRYTLDLTPEQFDILAAPQGGGTPKDPAPDE